MTCGDHRGGSSVSGDQGRVALHGGEVAFCLASGGKGDGVGAGDAQLAGDDGPTHEHAAPPN